MLLFSRGAELSVGEIAERAGIGQSTASEQLAQLRRAGIITFRREGKIVLYRADREGVIAAMGDLQPTCSPAAKSPGNQRAATPSGAASTLRTALGTPIEIKVIK